MIVPKGNFSTSAIFLEESASSSLSDLGLK